MYLYIIKTICLTPKTEKKLKQQYEIDKNVCNFWKDKTFEEYKTYLEKWQWHIYDFEDEDVGYYDDFEKAKNAVISNELDIHDGINNYVVIVKVSLNEIYPIIHKVNIFQFDKEIGQYKETETNKETMYIYNKIIGLERG